jgi:hypothetical protein
MASIISDWDKVGDLIVEIFRTEMVLKLKRVREAGKLKHVGND